VDRDEFNPNKYFNKIIRENVGGEDIIGIINDDIRFADGWSSDVYRCLKYYHAMSPGFAETEDTKLFERKVRDTSRDLTVIDGYFDACYFFRRELYDMISPLDENVIEWYDIDWYLSLNKIKIPCYVSRRVKIQHLKRKTFQYEEPDRKKVRNEIIQKYGKLGLDKAKKASVWIRNFFHV
jgi:hypothetical protein